MIDDKNLRLVGNKWCLNGIPYSGMSTKHGHLFWHKDGVVHREDGPAIERADGTKEWFIHNKRIRTWKEYHKLSTLSPQEQMIVKFRYGSN